MFYRFGNFPYDERMVYYPWLCISTSCKVSNAGQRPLPYTIFLPWSFVPARILTRVSPTIAEEFLLHVYMNGMMKWSMEEQICYSSFRSMHNSVVLFCLLVVFVFVCSNLRYMCHNGTGLSGAGALLASSTTWVLFAWGTLSIGRIGSIFLCTSRTKLIFKLIWRGFGSIAITSN